MLVELIIDKMVSKCYNKYSLKIKQCERGSIIMRVKRYEVQAYSKREDGKFDVTRSETTGARIIKSVVDIINAKSTVSHLIITNGQTEVFVTVDTEPYRVCIRTVKAHGAVDSEFKYIIALYKTIREMLKMGVTAFDENFYMCHEVCGVGIMLPDCLSYYLNELEVPKVDEVMGKNTSSLLVTARVQIPLNEIRGKTSAEIKWLNQVYDTSCAVQINRYVQKGNSYDDETMPSWYNEYSEPVLYICDWLTDSDFDTALEQFKQM